MNTQAAPVEKDPVCGMTVDPARAKATHEHAGKTYYFCCPGCKEKFKADPAKYLTAKPLVGIAPLSAHPVQIAPAPAVHSHDVPVVSARASSAPAKALQNEYTCPMDPEVRQQGPGDCPKCGMALEPTVAALPATKTEYTCPMHPEIVRDAPGNCPICGMALEPRTVSVGGEKKSGTGGYDQAVLDRHRADDSRSADCHVRFCSRDVLADARGVAEDLAMV